MSHYVKLFDSILRSTIWTAESSETLRVWIAMMALADRDGVVAGTVPGLAHTARVTIPECETALAKFLAPDPYSGTKDREGRRIEEVDGGWRLLNYEKFRDKQSPEEKRAKDAERQARKRERERHANERDEKRDCHASSRAVTKSRLSGSGSGSDETRTDLDGGGEPHPLGSGKQNLTKRVIAMLNPLWAKKYEGKGWTVANDDRRELGRHLANGLGEASDADLTDWFGHFLADERPEYRDRRHRLGQFLTDLDQFRVRRPTPSEYPKFT